MNRLPEGANWKQLNLAQLTKDDVKLVDLSLSSDAVWAVDDKVLHIRSIFHTLCIVDLDLLKLALGLVLCLVLLVMTQLPQKYVAHLKSDQSDSKIVISILLHLTTLTKVKS